MKNAEFIMAAFLNCCLVEKKQPLYRNFNYGKVCVVEWFLRLDCNFWLIKNSLAKNCH